MDHLINIKPFLGGGRGKLRPSEKKGLIYIIFGI